MYIMTYIGLFFKIIDQNTRRKNLFKRPTCKQHGRSQARSFAYCSLEDNQNPMF